MKNFHDTADLKADGKIYNVEFLSVPLSKMISAKVEGLGHFSLLEMGGKFRVMAGNGMTEELLAKLNDYIAKHIL